MARVQCGNGLPLHALALSFSLSVSHSLSLPLPLSLSSLSVRLDIYSYLLQHLSFILPELLLFPDHSVYPSRFPLSVQQRFPLRVLSIPRPVPGSPPPRRFLLSSPHASPVTLSLFYRNSSSSVFRFSFPRSSDRGDLSGGCEFSRHPAFRDDRSCPPPLAAAASLSRSRPLAPRPVLRRPRPSRDQLAFAVRFFLSHFR